MERVKAIINQVKSTTDVVQEDPLEYLLSDSDEQVVMRVELKDEGSEPKCATVLIQVLLQN